MCAPPVSNQFEVAYGRCVAGRPRLRCGVCPCPLLIHSRSYVPVQWLPSPASRSTRSRSIWVWSSRHPLSKFHASPHRIRMPNTHTYVLRAPVPSQDHGWHVVALIALFALSVVALGHWQAASRKRVAAGTCVFCLGGCVLVGVCVPLSSAFVTLSGRRVAHLCPAYRTCNVALWLCDCVVVCLCLWGVCACRVCVCVCARPSATSRRPSLDSVTCVCILPLLSPRACG